MDITCRLTSIHVKGGPGALSQFVPARSCSCSLLLVLGASERGLRRGVEGRRRKRVRGAFSPVCDELQKAWICQTLELGNSICPIADK